MVVKMKRLLFLMLVVLANTVSFAQFGSKQDVYNYLEGKTFSYYDHFMISFHNGILSMDWDKNYKCKMTVISFSQNTACLTGTIRIGYLRGDLLYNLVMSLDRRNNEFTLTGGPEDGKYKLYVKEQTIDVNKVYEQSDVDEELMYGSGGSNWKQSMMEFIANNVKYPVKAEENGVQGKVFVQIVVNSEGKIIEAEVKESVHPLLDKEAIRVVKSLQRWTPAKIKKVPVSSKMYVSVGFNLR